jgi:hypothetical protein
MQAYIHTCIYVCCLNIKNKTEFSNKNEENEKKKGKRGSVIDEMGILFAFLFTALLLQIMARVATSSFLLLPLLY